MEVLWIFGDIAVFCISLCIAIYIGITARKFTDKYFGTKDNCTL